jgi:hypothetical protein
LVFLLFGSFIFNFPGCFQASCSFLQGFLVFHVPVMHEVRSQADCSERGAFRKKKREAESLSC